MSFQPDTSDIEFASTLEQCYAHYVKYSAAPPTYTPGEKYADLALADYLKDPDNYAVYMEEKITKQITPLIQGYISQNMNFRAISLRLASKRVSIDLIKQVHKDCLFASAINLRDAGHTPAQAAAITGIDPRTLRRKLDGWVIPPRNLPPLTLFAGDSIPSGYRFMATHPGKGFFVVASSLNALSKHLGLKSAGVAKALERFNDAPHYSGFLFVSLAPESPS